MKRTVSFFLASSITDLQTDRKEIGDFINQLNNIYERDGMFIRLIKCEDESMNHSIVVGGTQKTLDELIEESDLCFVLFWHRAGAMTVHELEVAYSAFKAKESPKVIIYFKTVKESDDIQDDLRRVMDRIDNEMLYYHREYTHIDSLKLGIVTQLQVHGYIRADFSVEDNDVMIGGSKIADTCKLPLFARNPEYSELVSKYNSAILECQASLESYSKDKDNSLAYRNYRKSVKEMTRAKEDLAEMVDSILNIGKRISELSSSGIVTDRMRTAIKLFDIGDYQGVLETLNPDEIEESLRDIDAAQFILNQRIIGIVEEYRLRILALEAQRMWAEVREPYERAVAVVIDRPDVPKRIVLEYASYLFKQNQCNESIRVAELLLNSYNTTDRQAGSADKADLYHLLGTLYYTNLRYKDSEDYLLRAVAIRKELAENSREVSILLANTCVELANVYFKTNRHTESEQYYREALQIYHKLDTKGIQDIDIYITRTELDLGNLYYMINLHEEAQNTYYRAYKKAKELYSEDEHFADLLAAAGTKLAWIYTSLIRHKFSDPYYIEALEAKNSLSVKPAKAYYEYLADSCLKLSSLYSEKGFSEYSSELLAESHKLSKSIESGTYDVPIAETSTQADIEFYRRPYDLLFVENICQETTMLYERLAKDNPEAYDPLLANSYNILAYCKMLEAKYSFAELYHFEAIKIRERLAEINPDSMRTNLAGSFSNLAYNYYLCGRYEQSLEYSFKAIQIYQAVITGNSSTLDNDLARNYTALSDTFATSGKKTDAGRYYYNALCLYIKLYEKSPSAYIDRIINTAGKISALLCDGENKEWMDSFLRA